MRPAPGWIVLLPLGCAPFQQGYRSSDPLEAMLVAGSAAVATAAATTHTPHAARTVPPNPVPPPSAPPAPIAAQAAPAPARIRVPRAMIEGYVIGEERGWGIPNAVVKVTDGHNPPLRVRANADGRFQVPPPLAAGCYTLEVVDDCWEGSGEVEVVDGFVARPLVKAARRQPCAPVNPWELAPPGPPSPRNVAR
jgi:hypothetical protein